ncbi:MULTISPECIES: hypothetical protein [Mycobacterium]|uniref:Uncharacterized protein n=1 Tax=Mycobacterium paragordonae TaxID=1389713 RepID=A0ABQ1CF96_9MYCO|nr:MULTISPECIES: hypothetical protein [Mycobacterium]QNI09718.1 hypothetical protein GAN17_25295 [Mycobacterium kubicae]QNI15271.1 hypothetical protein GAN18_29265 [Mycobacterium kubicae]GFG83151.1 hypothetical protein MPRG_64270 [Mycobacterium paragordonae]
MSDGTWQFTATELELLGLKHGDILGAGTIGDAVANPDLISRSQYAVEFGNGDQLHRELVAELKTTRAQPEAAQAQLAPKSYPTPNCPYGCDCGMGYAVHGVNRPNPTPQPEHLRRGKRDCFLPAGHSGQCLWPR